MPYRDATPRVSLAQVRGRFMPRAFAALRTIVLDAGGVSTEVALSIAPGTGAVRGTRRWLVCPRCGRHVNVLGMIAPGTWVCACCGRWRSRNHVALDEPEVVSPEE